MRIHDRAWVREQLHKISVFLEEHFPGHYAEHLTTPRTQADLGDRVILILTELKMENDMLKNKNNALGRSLLEKSEEKPESDPEAEDYMPPIPMPGLTSAGEKKPVGKKKTTKKKTAKKKTTKKKKAKK